MNAADTAKLLAVRRAGAALTELLLKLEKDSHLRTAGGGRPAVVFLPEMIAYVVSRFPKEHQAALAEMLTGILPPEEERIRQGLIRGILRSAGDFSEQRDEIPGMYTVLCRFDAMAQAYEGAFYSRMQVENPGRLSEHYRMLLDAAYRIAAEAAGEDPGREDCLEKLIDFQRKMDF